MNLTYPVLSIPRTILSSETANDSETSQLSFVRSRIFQIKKLINTSAGSKAPGTMLILFLVFGFMVFLNFDISAQTGAPCNAIRWTKGGHWSGTGCGVNDANNAPAPLGIVRCANAADTESGIDDNTTYNPSNFTITPNSCEDPNTNLPVTITPPFSGQKISWFNFDVRPYAGIYDFQTIATGSYDLEWALYYSSAATCSTGGNGLSGDCAQLDTLIGCGVAFTGWSPQPFITPIFNLPTNLYLVVWRKGATNSSNDDFDFTFKARYGCGDVCSLFADGAPTVTCNPNGSYTVVQNLNGTNTTVTVTAPGSTSIVTSPSPLVFTTADAIPNVNNGTVTVTYPAGVNYNITMTPSGAGTYCTVLNIAGTAPNCCIAPTCSIDGPATVCPNTTTVHCAPVGAAGYAWAISGAGGTISGPTDQPCVSVTSSGTCNTTYTLTLTIGSVNCNSMCTKMVSVNDVTPPTITCTTQTTPINCPATPVFVAPTATDACDATVSITFSDIITQGLCAGTYSTTRTWTATDDCGNSATCSRTIVVQDVTPPTITCSTQTTPINCPATPMFVAPTATDACDATVSITFSDIITQGLCAGTYSTTRTWTATDDCGNSATCSRTIVVQDVTPPTITCATQTSPINCPASPVFVAPTATDACDATVSITFSDVTTTGSCAGTYSVTRTWTATDDCGNSATCSRTIVVQDVTPPTITCVNQTSPISCPATPVFVAPTATDACDATVSITFSDVTTAGLCAGTYSTTRTWTATDDCGNSATCSRTIVVQDVTPPSITCVSQTSPISCPATPVFVAPTATDACDATVSITFSDVTTAGLCAGTYSTTRTWTATDDCGNSATCSRTIVVQDITPPTITCATQTTPINCPATPVFVAPTATDACDATVSITFSDVTTAGLCAGTYSTTRTWTATDDCGNSATCSRTIVVQDITPPTITCVAQTTPINCPATPVFVAPTATDACDATVSITFSDVTTTGSCAGTYSTTRTWTATDDCGNSATCSRTIVVQDVTPPTITCVTQTSPINCPATPVFVAPTATDACDATVSITFSDVTTQGSCTGAYSTTRTWTATDDCGNSATCSRTIVVRDITPPTITCVAQTSPINCPATPVFVAPTATDACDATVSITFSDVTATGSCSGTYSVTRTWTATDDCGNSATCSRTIVVQDITPPTITCATQTTPINCPATPVFIAPTATDACDATVSITFSDVTATGSCAGTYSVTRTWTATDDCGNSATCSRTIVVRDITAPTITCSTQTTPINCPATPVFVAPTATDACDATVSITFSDVTATGSCAGTYSVTRTWTATDDCGNSATCSRTILVQDITPPTITCVAQTTPINCPATPVFTPPTATDACDATVSITFSDVITPGSCAGTYSTTRTWTATDDCGNSATCSRTIVVQDITPPTITCVAQTTPINCPATPVFTPPTATDACDATVSITFSDVTTQGSCAGTYSTTRTWTATDDCGNSATCSRTIVVQDITPPTITCVTQTTPINCPATPVFVAPTATDACDATVSITFSDVTAAGSCAGTYSTTRTWTATDDCGNSATCSRTIVVRDITAPTITCATQTSPINCPATPVFVAPTATDACDATVSITFSDVTTQGSCAGTYSTTRTWTATDDCGNSSTCSRTIVVQDITPPTITCVAQTTPINCPATPVFVAPTATDACDATVSITFSDVTATGSCAGTYSVTRTWTATDDCGNSATCSRTIVVQDITPPTITCVAQTTPINCPATPVFVAPTATDACDATVSITFSDVTTQGSCTGAYSTTRTWTATDDCGNSATCSRTIVVRDITAPTITCATQTTPINCPSTPIFVAPTATDACDATVSITFSDVTATGSCAGTYSVTRTWTATDDCGNSATCSRTIVVRDITPPTIACATQTTPINCPASPVFTAPTATDACDATVSITFSDVTTQGSCAGTYNTTRTWTATDDCGNSATCSRTIVVQDITPPTITCVTQTTPINCPAIPVFVAPTATDACDATVSITFSDVTTQGSCAGTYSTTRTWTATDDCGNSATCSRTIVVRDITPPVCLTQNITVSINPNIGFVTITAVQIDNGSIDECGGVLLNVSPATFTCSDAGPNLVTLTVTDFCGNSSTCSATVTVETCFDSCVTVNAWVYLEGSAINPNGQNVFTVPMRTTLNNLHVLPGQTLVDPFFGNKYTPPGQPYDIAPWNYMGMEGDTFDSGGMPPGDANYQATVVDWVLVSLRADSAGTGGPVCQAAALLHKNGYIAFVAPFDCCDLDLLSSYYLAIEHRNHLLIMSPMAIPIVPGVDSSTITYDFRMQQSYIDDPFMTGVISGQKELLPSLPGIFAMIAGNGNQTTTMNSDIDINFDDRSFWEGENGQIGEYRTGDYNMNGDTNFNDRVVWERNNGKFTSVPRN